MEVLAAENASHIIENISSDEIPNGTTTSNRNVNIDRAPTMQTNSVETSPTTRSSEDPVTSVVYVSDGVDNTSSGFKTAIPNSVGNREIVINAEAQSPVKDQLLKLREFDDFVESLGKDICQTNSKPPVHRSGGIIQSVTIATIGKDVHKPSINLSVFDQQKTSENDADQKNISGEKRAELSTPIIINSSTELGGLMGMVSSSPVDSPIRHSPTAATIQTSRTFDRTIKSNAALQSTNLYGSDTSRKSSFPVLVPLSSKHRNAVDSTDLSMFDPHAPTKSSPSPAKESWVLFEDDTDDRMSTSSRGTSMSSSSVRYQGMSVLQSQFLPSPAHSGVGSPAGSGFVKDWFNNKLETHSPRFCPTPPVVVPQHTGGSVHSSLYSCECLPDDKSDHQSEITASASALSVQGSCSGSHDNISHEYMPLESPKNMPASIPEGWVKFDETAPTSPTKSKIYFVGTTKPGHTRSQSTGGQLDLDVFNKDVNRRRASSTAVTSHLNAPQEELLASSGGVNSKAPSEQASPSIPIQEHKVKESNLFHQQKFLQNKQQSPDMLQRTSVQQHVALPEQTNITTQVQSKNVTNLQQRHTQHLLQQQILLHQQQQYQLHKQKLVSGGGQLQQIQEQQLIQTSAIESQNAALCLDSSAYQSPKIAAGNPFKEELLQQNLPSAASYPGTKDSSINDINITPRSATASPFNPFRRSVNDTNGKSGPVTSTTSWEIFDDQKSKRHLTSSPGNPFKQMMITANIHPGQNVSDPSVYETIEEPRYIVMPDTTKTVTSGSKPPQLPAGHPHSSPAQTVPQTPTTLVQLAEQSSHSPQVLNNLKSAASNTSKSVPVQSQVDNIGDSEVTLSGQKPEIEIQQQTEEESPTSFVDEYPREEVDPTEGWSLMLRCPDKKKLTSSRYWKPVHVRLMDGNVIQLFDDRTRKEPFRELALQSNYEFGDSRLQAYDTRGKIHTIKIFYVSYKEKKRYSTLETQEKILSMESLIKLGSTDYKVFKSFIYSVNEALMKLSAFRDRGRHYQQDMMTITVTDDYHGYIDYSGEVLKQSIVTDVNVLAFLSGMPECALGLNDSQVRGAEIVSRRDIIPNKTGEWIKFEKLLLHKCVNQNVFSESRFIEFSPLDGCRFKLMQFNTRPRSKELPMHVKVKVSGDKNHIDMRADLYLPARTAKQNILHYVCQDIMIRVPLPESWIRYFRKEKRIQGISSIKSVTKKADHIKSGSSKPKLIEVSVGSAKYEHAYRAVVWRIDRLPERSTKMAVTQIMRVQLDLLSMNELPVSFSQNTEVEYIMPHTTASKTTVRSLAVATDTSPDKRVRYTAKYEYQVEIEKSFEFANQCVVQ